MERSLYQSDRVLLRPCDGYGAPLGEIVKEMLDEMLREAGLDSRGKRVLLKPNLLAKRRPDAGITTDPAFVRAAAEFFLERGAHVVIADSPGGVYSRGTLEGIYRTTGMEQAARETGAELNFDTGAERVSTRREGTVSYFTLITPVVQADIVVNLARLKTHAMCEMSAAVKNMFGTIPGLQKAEMHARFPGRAEFAEMLTELCMLTAPQLSLVDGIVGMEGNGPAGGKPRKVGVIVGGINPFAVDRVCAELIGYKSREVGTVKAACDKGLCPEELSRIDTDEELLRRFSVRFERPDGYAGGLLKQLPHLFGGRLQKWIEPKPVIDRDKCIGCGRCADCCPKKTIRLTDGKAHIDPEHCIKCYCCQEMCPAKAVRVKSKRFWRL